MKSQGGKERSSTKGVPSLSSRRGTQKTRMLTTVRAGKNRKIEWTWSEEGGLSYPLRASCSGPPQRQLRFFYVPRFPASLYLQPMSFVFSREILPATVLVPYTPATTGVILKLPPQLPVFERFYYWDTYRQQTEVSSARRGVVKLPRGLVSRIRTAKSSGVHQGANCVNLKGFEAACDSPFR